MLKQEGDNYYITDKQNFQSIDVVTEKLKKKVLDFAYDMTFGRTGEHRAYRSGGQKIRRNGEQFINTYQGKLAECGVFLYLWNNGIRNIEKPDFETWELGRWDTVDILCNGKKLNIKSTKHYGNLLLLETKDWNNKGEYIPNIKKGDNIYDLFLLTRIRPDGESEMKRMKLLYVDILTNEQENQLKKRMMELAWEFDIAGVITNEMLIEHINNNRILPQNALLNGKIRMDAENYYLQAGKMLRVDELIGLL